MNMNSNNEGTLGTLSVIDSRVDNTIPWEKWADDILICGYSIIKISAQMQHDFQIIQRLSQGVEYSEKQKFSFIERTDGYFPVGYSFIGDENRDRCEIFNYWHRFKAEHQRHMFSNSDLYSRIASYEDQVCIYGQKIIDAILRRYNYKTKMPIRDDSYLQINSYLEHLRSGQHRYLQERHEDGHLITIIKPNAPGLVIFRKGGEHLVDIAHDQAIVISGSLLTELSDGEIEPTYHAVLNLTLPVARASIVYNVNVLCDAILNFKQNRKVNMYAIANERHLAFGHAPYVRASEANGHPAIDHLAAT